MAANRSTSRSTPPTSASRKRLAAEQEALRLTRRRNRLFTGVAGGLLALLLGVVAVVQLRGADSPDTAASGVGATVREDSHRLNDVADGKVTFVEFLDFECEGCRAAFPVVEQLRSTYGDRVSFVVRYFPLPGHVNGERAARAVEAAAQQGQFEAMYRQMYETQTQWGEQQTPQDDAFRDLARKLGLDMTRWEADYTSPATKARIQTDIDDGTSLGVTGTPSFFLNGERLDPKSVDELTVAIETALAGS